MDSQPRASWENVLKDWRAVLVVVPVCIALIPISIVAACQWAAVREAEVQAALKRDLIDRGLSAAEVERLARGPSERWRDPDSSPYYRSQHAAIELELKKELIAQGRSGEDVEAVLRAAASLRPASGQYSYQTAADARKEADFIKDLVQRGRSTSDIERILGAAPAAAIAAAPMPREP